MSNHHPPKFWYPKEGTTRKKISRILAFLLTPFSWIYGGITQARLSFTRPTKVGIPVICVGNLTVGGTGKSPIVIALVKLLKDHGHTPHIISRGYKGKLAQKITNPILVNLTNHTAQEVGDEPMLLAQQAPTWIGSDRVASAQQAIASGATILIMDDGLQNPSLFKDLKIGVFDGTTGIGNGHVFPAGPLRQPLHAGLKLIDVALLVNYSETYPSQMILRNLGPQIDEDFNSKIDANSPLFKEILETKGSLDEGSKIVKSSKRGIPSWLNNIPCFQAQIQTAQKPRPETKYLAFAGIANPQKFFNTLSENGFKVAETRSFPDHYSYTQKDLRTLKETAHKKDLRLITTEKDGVKLPLDFKKDIDILKINLIIGDAETLLAEYLSPSSSCPSPSNLSI